MLTPACAEIKRQYARNGRRMEIEKGRQRLPSAFLLVSYCILNYLRRKRQANPPILPANTSSEDGSGTGAGFLTTAV